VDPNWFFSSVAQFVAALVGILSGFVTSRVISSQVEFAKKRARTSHLVAEAKLLIERFSRVNIARYDMHANDYAMASLRDVLAERQDLEDAEQLYQAGSHLFSLFTPAADHRARVARELEWWTGPSAENVRRSYAIGINEGQFTKEGRAARWQELTAERDDIRKVVDDARKHLSACRQHHKDMSVQPESSGAALAAIAVTLFLFFVGVVYPLTFLNVTAEQSNAKLLILACTSVTVFLAAIGALYFVAVRLRYSTADRNELERYCSASAYSRHLDTFEKNVGSL
jgi:hypothetical protein